MDDYLGKFNHALFAIYVEHGSILGTVEDLKLNLQNYYPQLFSNSMEVKKCKRTTVGWA